MCANFLQVRLVLCYTCLWNHKSTVHTVMYKWNFASGTRSEKLIWYNIIIFQYCFMHSDWRKGLGFLSGANSFKFFIYVQRNENKLLCYFKWIIFLAHIIFNFDLVIYFKNICFLYSADILDSCSVESLYHRINIKPEGNRGGGALLPSNWT